MLLHIDEIMDIIYRFTPTTWKNKIIEQRYQLLHTPKLRPTRRNQRKAKNDFNSSVVQSSEDYFVDHKTVIRKHCK